jgi:predicted N-formylglutamate amidohydrolase
VPYSGRDPEGLTVDLHAARRGWPHVCIEVRQDLLAREGGVAAWVERLGAALKPILAQPQLYQALEVAP